MESTPIHDALTRAATAMKSAALRVAGATLNALDVGRQARIEAELDRKQDELRATILQLATALGANAHEARKALIRESYLASGIVPDIEETAHARREPGPL